MLKRFRHWSPRYLQDRLAVMSYERRHPEAPWLAAQMIEILASWLKPTDVGLEWGSGRSSAWLARRVRYLTSVEDNPEWAERVERMTAAAGHSAHVNLHRAPLTDDDLARPADARYVLLAQELGPASLDFTLVDGWSASRLLCGRHARSPETG